MSTAAHIGGPLGCIGLAGLLVGRWRTLRLAGLAAWALGAILLAAYLAPAGHHVVLAVAGVLGAALAVAGAPWLRRSPWLLAFATLLLVPARIPVTVGDVDANLLIPLYVVVGAAAVELFWAILHGDERRGELGLVAWPLAAFVVWTGLSLSWTLDLQQGSIELLFFYLPFGVLALCLARLPWEPAQLPRLLVQLVAMGLVFAIVGIYQEAARDVFWNPKVIVGDVYQSFFRVNSLFWDPSIYGRFLVVAILASLVVALRRIGSPVFWAAAGAICVLWAGLLFSYSQTSFASLLACVLVAVGGTLRWRPAPALVTASLVAALVLVLPQRTPASPHVATGVVAVTSGRGKLITEGVKIALDHPLGGVGVGGFKHSYANRVGLRGAEPQRAASHTTPVTVAAETGVVGFGLFLWLAVAVFLVAFRRAGPGRVGEAAFVLGLILLAIAAHSLGYADLFEDPMAWAALGLALCVARAPREAHT